MKAADDDTALYFVDGTHPSYTAHAAHGWIRKGETRELGSVDGFNQDQSAREADNCFIARHGLFAAHRDPLEAFQLSDGLFDTGTCPVKKLRKELWSTFGVRTVRDDRSNAALATGGAVLC